MKGVNQSVSAKYARTNLCIGRARRCAGTKVILLLLMCLEQTKGDEAGFGLKLLYASRH